MTRMLPARRRAAPLAAALALLSACGGTDPQPTGGVSADEAAALNDAAAMLDNQALAMNEMDGDQEVAPE